MSKHLVIAIALALAGRANMKTGEGITVTDARLASEVWCTEAEAHSVRQWLVEEKWFTESEGKNWIQLACNFEMARKPGVDPVESRSERQRARNAAKNRAYRERMKHARSVTVPGHGPVMLPGHETPARPGTVTGVTGDRDQSDRGPLPEPVTGSVISAGHSPVSSLKFPISSHISSAPLRVAESESQPAETDEHTQAAPSLSSEALFPQPPETGRPATRNNYPPEFEKAWKLYGMRGSKKDAFKEWNAALKRADLDAILKAIQRYVDATPDLKYRLHLFRWLKGDYWESDPGPARQPTWNPSAFSRDRDWSSQAAASF
jgi:hypothetical protein